MRVGVLASALLLAACATATTEDSTQPRKTRELSNKEKESLRAVLLQGWLTTVFPDEARFKWMPVIYVPGKAETDYCGLVSQKGIFGHEEFQQFHAVISQTNGEFLQGRMTRAKRSGAGLPTYRLGEAISNRMVD